MPHADAIGPALSLHRTMMHRKSNAISLAQRNYLGTRLHARTMFGQHKLSASKIQPRFGQQNSNLDGKDVFAIEVLMQTVVVAFPVLKQQRSRAHLSGVVTSLNEGFMLFRITNIKAHGKIPAIGIRGKLGIKSMTKPVHDPGKGIVEVLVFSAAEAMSSHDNLTAKWFVFGIKSGESATLIGSKK